MPKPERCVDLNLAFMWTCPECGRDVFERGITIEDPELIADAQEYFGGEGELQIAPTRVTCPHCKIKFQAKES